MKRRMAALLAVTTFATGILGSSLAAYAEDYCKLRVGILPFVGSVPVDYADKMGYFEDAGLDIELYSFATGAPLNEAFAAGQVDIAVIGLAGVITMANGTSHCIYETNTASGGNGVFVRPDSEIAKIQGECADYPELYGSEETLKGITILGQLATSSQLETIMYLDHFGLTQEDVNFVNIESGTDYQAFKSGEGDAVALMTPYTYQAIEDGYVCAAYFTDSSDYVVPDTMLATNEIMESDRETVKAFLEVYLRAVDELKADDQLMFDTAKQYYIESGKEYEDSNLTHDLEDRYLIGKEELSDPDYVYGAGMWEVGKLFFESGKIEEDNLPNIINSLDTSLINEIYGFDVAKQTAD